MHNWFFLLNYYSYSTIILILYRPTAVESSTRAMELSLAPEFTLCPTAEFTMAMLKKVFISNLCRFYLSQESAAARQPPIGLREANLLQIKKLAKSLNLT